MQEFKLSFEKDKDKTFVIVEVMKGQQTPYYYEGDGQLVAFIRIENESVPATPSQLRELVLRGSGERLCRPCILNDRQQLKERT